MAKRFTVGSEPQVEIETVEGSLRLVGWDNDEILVKVSDEDALNSQQDKDKVVISCDENLTLNVPRFGSISIGKVNGDMSVRGVNGPLQVGQVQGDVAIRDIGALQLEAVESDFSLRGARGDVHVKSIGGDAVLREIQGNLTLKSVSNDLVVQAVDGNLDLDVDEDMVLHLVPQPSCDYRVVAGADIMLVLPDDASVTLTMSADNIAMNYPGIESDDSTTRTVSLGEGAAKLKLDAGGNILVSTRAQAAESADEFGNFAGLMFDWSGFGSEMGERWGNFGRDFGERISRRAHAAAERAARKAEAAGRRVERQHLKRARETGRKAKLSFMWDSEGVPGASRSDPVSDEERMHILNMLAEKKISADEAEKLLSALEGGQ